MNQFPQPPQSGAFLRFWTTLPGLLTAAAAVITAVGTIYVASLSSSKGAAPPPVPPTTTTVTVAPSTPPAAASSISPVSLDVNAVDPNTLGDAAADSLLSDCANGSATACADFVETMAQGCYNGDLFYCDVLFVVSPSNSLYEEFGATCGYRLSTTEYANKCSVL
jgi:hypothetical protein